MTQRRTSRDGGYPMDRAEWLRSAYRKLLKALEEALFDDISDAAETRALDRVGRIRQTVVARLRSDSNRDAGARGEDGLDWDAGLLQMIAALNEARRARKGGDAHRDSLMTGFLVGLMHWEPGMRYKHGSLRDAVIALHDRDAESACRWAEAESIEAEEWRGESAGADQRPLLLRWVGDRLAAGHRLSGPLFFSVVGETEDERREREASEKAYFAREEDSIRRAQNFGKRIAGKDTDGIWIPGSYAVNRALVLDSHREDDPVDNEQEK